MRKKIVAGNWKMNLTFKQGKELTEEVVERVSNTKRKCEVILIPSFIHLAAIERITEGYSVKIGAQNNNENKDGAFTGEVSASMLKSVGVNYALVGHSERRTYYHESDETLLAKSKALLAEDIKPIFCCGEALEDRKNERHFDIVKDQLEVLWSLKPEEFEHVIIAYEPVWAIGTGETASAEQAQEMHAFIRDLIKKQKGEKSAEATSILYGGSCNPSNAKELFAQADVDGGLIGGASLKINDFMSIVKSFN
ncbi:MAG: triose-phosphate isomerase [Vicingaceae bacterium]